MCFINKQALYNENIIQSAKTRYVHRKNKSTRCTDKIEKNIVMWITIATTTY